MVVRTHSFLGKAAGLSFAFALMQFGNLSAQESSVRWTAGAEISTGEASKLALVAGEESGQYTIKDSGKAITFRLLIPSSGRTYPISFQGANANSHTYTGPQAKVTVVAVDDATVVIDFQVADNIGALAIVDCLDSDATGASLSTTNNAALTIGDAGGDIRVVTQANRVLRTRKDDGFEVAAAVEPERRVRVAISRNDITLEQIAEFETGPALEPVPAERRIPTPTPVVRVGPVTSPQQSE